MASHRFYLLSLCLIWFVYRARADIVTALPCEDNPGNCKIHEVRVEPCPEAEEDKPCKVKRGKSATIEFDYTTQWNATKAYGSVYSVTDDDVLSLPDMNTNACEFTTCPIVQSERKTYRYTLALAKKFPVGTYSTRWVLRDSDKDENSQDRCCFSIRIKLTK